MVTFDFSSKRAKLALRFFTYGVMTVATLVLSTILLFFALGYRLDNEFNFTQGGLVQFRSFPDGATVVVDGREQGFKTPNKLNMTTGEHTIEFKHAGYRPWTKTFTLGPGQLTWLNYARLIPQDVRTDAAGELTDATAMMGSPDRRWLLIQSTSSVSELTLVDVSNEREPKFTSVTIPEDTITQKPGGALKIVEWDLGSRYILLEYQADSTREFIRIDRTRPTEAINISKQFGLPILQAHFMGSNPHTLLANTDGVLRRLDLTNTSASGVLVDGLRYFMVHGDGSAAFLQVAQTSEAVNEQRVGVFKGDETTIVRTLPAEQKALLAYGEYDNHEYLALATGDGKHVELIRDPSAAGAKESNTIFAQFELPASAQWLSFSGSGRMVVAQAGNHLATYDVEEGRIFNKTLAVGAEITTQMKWLDDFYLWTDAGGTFSTVEFDGTNQQQILAVAPGFGGMLSSNGKRLFTVGKTETGLQLQSSKLVLED